MTETIDMVPFELRVEAWILVLGLAVGYQWAMRNLGPRLPDFDPGAGLAGVGPDAGPDEQVSEPATQGQPAPRRAPSGDPVST